MTNLVAVVGATKIGVRNVYGVTLYQESGKILFSDSYKSIDNLTGAKRTLVAFNWGLGRLNQVLGSEEIPYTDQDDLTVLVNSTVLLWLERERISVVHRKELEDVLYTVSCMQLPTYFKEKTKKYGGRFPILYKRLGLKAYSQKYTKASELFPNI